MFVKTWVKWVVFVLIVMALVGCGGDDPTPTPMPTDPPATEEPTAADTEAETATSTEGESDSDASDTSEDADAGSEDADSEDADSSGDENQSAAGDVDSAENDDSDEEPQMEESSAADADETSGSDNTSSSDDTDGSDEATNIIEVSQPEDEDIMSMASLAIGTPGRYVNVAYGYIATYPDDWFTGFGNRPILASFSNLDPGTTNRQTMRETGCLIETNVSPNVYGATLQTMMAQLPETYADAESITLGGVDAVRIRRDNTNLPYTSEIVQAVADGRQFTITTDMSREEANTCQSAWEELLANWEWFTPDFATYRNTDYGYSFSHPRAWFVSVISDRGEVVFSAESEGELSLEDLAQRGMAVHTDVLENPDVLPLKQWITTNVPNPGLTNDILADTLVGVRSITNWPDGTQKMIGYFQGPLGRIYAVSCSYPIERSAEFRPIANAILYSFGF